MSTEKLKGYLGAFVVGGCIGVTGQIIMEIYLYLGLSPLTSMQLMVFTIAVIGSVLTIFGVYQKLTDIGGMGAMMPMSGLAGGITVVLMDLRKKGFSKADAVAGSVRAPVKIFAAGIAVALLLVLLAK